MTGLRENKRLARVLRCMVEDGAELADQGDGSWVLVHARRQCARLRQSEVARALSQGLLRARSKMRVFADTEARSWLARHDCAGEQDIFAAQHRAMQTVSLIDAGGDIIRARKNTAESPLAWLRRRHGADGAAYLSASEFAAGERLRQDYFRSSLAQRLCADWSAPLRGRNASGPRNAVLDAADSALAAKGRFMDALAALGPGLDDLVFGICIREYSLQSVERAYHWRRRSAKLMLKRALERLAKHYRL